MYSCYIHETDTHSGTGIIFICLDCAAPCFSTPVLAKPGQTRKTKYSVLLEDILRLLLYVFPHVFCFSSSPPHWSCQFPSRRGPRSCSLPLMALGGCKQWFSSDAHGLQPAALFHLSERRLQQGKK